MKSKQSDSNFSSLLRLHFIFFLSSAREIKEEEKVKEAEKCVKVRRRKFMSVVAKEHFSSSWFIVNKHVCKAQEIRREIHLYVSNITFLLVIPELQALRGCV